MNQPKIKVLSRPKESREQPPGRGEQKGERGKKTETPADVEKIIDLSAFKLKHESEARTFKLINAKNWTIVDSEPVSESHFFSDGNPAMSVIATVGPFGVGKSDLLNKLAHKRAFRTHHPRQPSRGDDAGPSRMHTSHTTRGVDIHVTHHRILLDCQPLLSASVEEDFLSGRSHSPFRDSFGSLEPDISSCTISLQLVAFLLATCDYLVIMIKALDDSSLLQLIGLALRMRGETSDRAKLVIFNEDKAVCGREFGELANKHLGANTVDRLFHDQRELLIYISSYTNDKCEKLARDSSRLIGREWLAYASDLWYETINASVFADNAKQLQRTINHSRSRAKAQDKGQ